MRKYIGKVQLAHFESEKMHFQSLSMYCYFEKVIGSLEIHCFMLEVAQWLLLSLIHPTSWFKILSETLKILV